MKKVQSYTCTSTFKNKCIYSAYNRKNDDELNVKTQHKSDKYSDLLKLGQ